MELITAKEACQIAQRGENADNLNTLTLLCRAIREASRRGLVQVITEGPLADDDVHWLEINGYTAWQRTEYRKKRYLISWEDAHL